MQVTLFRSRSRQMRGIRHTARKQVRRRDHPTEGIRNDVRPMARTLLRTATRTSIQSSRCWRLETAAAGSSDRRQAAVGPARRLSTVYAALLPCRPALWARHPRLSLPLRDLMGRIRPPIRLVARARCQGGRPSTGQRTFTSPRPRKHRPIPPPKFPATVSHRKSEPPSASLRNCPRGPTSEIGLGMRFRNNRDRSAIPPRHHQRPNLDRHPRRPTKFDRRLDNLDLELLVLVALRD